MKMLDLKARADVHARAHLFHLGQLPARVLVISQVLLVAHEDDGHVGAKVFDFGRPLLWNVLCEGETKT